MIKNFDPRLYQQTILATAINYNTLVVLPTGMGKTMVAVMLAVQRLRQYPKSKILILSPTKPLVEQHMRSFQRYTEINADKVVMFTGTIKPEKRAEMWKDAQIIISTPQGLENDIINNKINLENVSLITFDEAHRAVGNYSYCWIAKQYRKQANYPRILGLTASPGSEQETIKEVCKNLAIEEIEIRTEEDPDVKPYIQDIKINWEKVELPHSFKQIKKFLDNCYKDKLNQVHKYGYVRKGRYFTKKDLLRAMGQMHIQISQGNKDFAILKSVSLLAEAMKVQHAIELLETQGITPLFQYMEKLNTESRTSKVKAVQNLVRDLNFRSAFIQTRNMFQAGVEHPKLVKLMNILKGETKDKDIKIIVFNQYRDSAAKITDEINEIKTVNAKLFVGQAKKKGTGLTQKKQIEMLEQFRNGEFNVLVSSSVGEEGLDIPAVDIVIFFEPIPSAIRTIQRKGRTGRLEKGKVIVLLAKGTRDEAYRWSAHHKQKRMFRNLINMKNGSTNLKPEPIQQPKLKDFSEKPKIYADFREKGTGIIKQLIDLGTKMKLETLAVGDYVLSRRCVVEFKTTKDFVDSIVDGRLLEQAKQLKFNFEKPILIVEGEEDIYGIRKIHPNAIRGMLATLAVSYGIPILYTKDNHETASLLHIIAKREQEKGEKDFSLHSIKPRTLKERQEFIVSSLPGIESKLGKNLLKHFKSIKKIVNAKKEQLQKVELIGPKKAKAIKDIVEKEYEEN